MSGLIIYLLKPAYMHEITCKWSQSVAWETESKHAYYVWPYNLPIKTEYMHEMTCKWSESVALSSSDSHRISSCMSVHFLLLL